MSNQKVEANGSDGPLDRRAFFKPNRKYLADWIMDNRLLNQSLSRPGQSGSNIPPHPVTAEGIKNQSVAAASAVEGSQVEVEDLSFSAGFFRQLVEEAVRPSYKLRTSYSSCSICIGREMRFLL